MDLDDDNDGILDEVECPSAQVSTTFETSNGNLHWRTKMKSYLDIQLLPYISSVPDNIFFLD